MNIVTDVLKTIPDQHDKQQKVKFRIILILNFRKKELLRESDKDLTCATQELPTYLVDLEYCSFVVELGILTKQ